jgi:hypothetical protein
MTEDEKPEEKKSENKGDPAIDDYFEETLPTIWEKTKSISGHILFFVLLIIGVILIQVQCWIWIEENIQPDRQGVFGDMFGSVNTLFSGLAFAGVIFAIYLQGRELSETRAEVKLTRLAHQQTCKIMGKQLEILVNTSKLETIRYRKELIKYRKEILPYFVIHQSQLEIRGDENGYSNGRFYLQNVGQKINEVIITQTRDGIPKDIKIIDSDYPLLEEMTIFPIESWHSKSKNNSTLQYTMCFCTMDGVLWENKLTVFIYDNKINTLIFGDSVEAGEPEIGQQKQ